MGGVRTAASLRFCLCSLLVVAAPVVAGVARAPADWTGWVYYYYDLRHGTTIWQKGSGDPKWRDAGVYGGYRGALSFDLSVLPDSQVVAAKLCYRSQPGFYSTPSTLTFCATRFELLPAQAMWGDIGGGAGGGGKDGG